MITFLTILLSITIVGVGISYKEITKLRKRLDDLHKETNTRVSTYNIETNDKFDRDVNTIHAIFGKKQEELDTRLKNMVDTITKKIPITNDELLKEVQKMRDDFLALRQNL